MKWISVKDRLPEIAYENQKSFIRVITWDGKKVRELSYRHISQHDKVCGIFYFRYGGGKIISITHWMPLPDPPSKPTE